MNKPELLSPAGDFECLVAAIQNGANAVYLGSSMFSARASATNFDYEELKKAIEYAHLRNVKINLTLNTLIKNQEFSDAFEVAKKAYEFGVDAIIVQDLGLAKQLINAFPDITKDMDFKEKGLENIVEEAFKIASDKTKGIHISYDLDLIDPETAPGVSIPEFDGITEEEAMKIKVTA